MRFIADLHIHSRYSRATSSDMSPESLWKWAQLKGINVVATGDFTHPHWHEEIKEKLYTECDNLFKLKDNYKINNVPPLCVREVCFLLTAEVSCIYKKNGKVRKVHCLIFAPDLAVVSKINIALSRIGNIASDGRPILGLDAKNLLEIILDISDKAMLVPAHIWTPHFSVFGAVSGFDSLEECFDELTAHIYALETGLSSNPSMNWRLSSLDKITLISNSDAHSPSKLGREANIFDTEISYQTITEAIKTRKGFLGTVEFFPEEGKYHYDGHRSCDVNLSPEETRRHNYLCPVCGKKVTVGVLHRVEKLADRKNGFSPEGALPFYSLIPLQEIIAQVMKVGVNSKAVNKQYFHLIESLGNEFAILMDTPLDAIERAGSLLLREAIHRMRSGNVHIVPGYDGEFGKIKIFEAVERKEIKGQTRLF
ncbi:MAG: DNA helicase UvrD [Nitrospira sp.]|nr:DNA helicase UvrD [Nitrospira sp.]